MSEVMVMVMVMWAVQPNIKIALFLHRSIKLQLPHVVFLKPKRFSCQWSVRRWLVYVPILWHHRTVILCVFEHKQYNSCCDLLSFQLFYLALLLLASISFLSQYRSFVLSGTFWSSFYSLSLSYFIKSSRMIMFIVLRKLFKCSRSFRTRWEREREK